MIPIRLIIADDHEIFRHGLAAVFRECPDIELVDQASNGRQLIAQVKQHKPDVVLTDIEMDEMDGIQAASIICKMFPTIAVIAMSMHDDDYTIMEILRAGASGYLVKKAPKEVVVEAIRSSFSGAQYYCRNSSRRISALISSRRYDPRNPERSDLSAIEVKIIRMICEEKVNKEIAQQLNLSVPSIDRYRQGIFQKAEVSSTAGLMLYAIRNGVYRI